MAYNYGALGGVTNWNPLAALQRRYGPPPSGPIVESNSAENLPGNTQVRSMGPYGNRALSRYPGGGVSPTPDASGPAPSPFLQRYSDPTNYGRRGGGDGGTFGRSAPYETTDQLRSEGKLIGGDPAAPSPNANPGMGSVSAFNDLNDPTLDHLTGDHPVSDMEHSWDLPHLFRGGDVKGHVAAVVGDDPNNPLAEPEIVESDSPIHVINHEQALADYGPGLNELPHFSQGGTAFALPDDLMRDPGGVLELKPDNPYVVPGSQNFSVGGDDYAGRHPLDTPMPDGFTGSLPASQAPGGPSSGSLEDVLGASVDRDSPPSSAPAAVSPEGTAATASGGTSAHPLLDTASDGSGPTPTVSPHPLDSVIDDPHWRATFGLSPVDSNSLDLTPDQQTEIQHGHALLGMVPAAGAGPAAAAPAAPVAAAKPVRKVAAGFPNNTSQLDPYRAALNPISKQRDVNRTMRTVAGRRWLEAEEIAQQHAQNTRDFEWAKFKTTEDETQRQHDAEREHWSAIEKETQHHHAVVEQGHADKFALEKAKADQKQRQEDQELEGGRAAAIKMVKQGLMTPEEFQTYDSRLSSGKAWKAVLDEHNKLAPPVMTPLPNKPVAVSGANVHIAQPHQEAQPQWEFTGKDDNGRYTHRINKISGEVQPIDYGDKAADGGSPLSQKIKAAQTALN